VRGGAGPLVRRGVGQAAVRTRKEADLSADARQCEPAIVRLIGTLVPDPEAIVAPPKSERYRAAVQTRWDRRSLGRRSRWDIWTIWRRWSEWGALVDKLAAGEPYRITREELPRDHPAGSRADPAICARRPRRTATTARG
jgi:hypothetical protein